jgi:anthranilate/para-aminobenzoate synthase component II
MALAHRTAPVFGVQFHPESVGTEVGMWLIQNFLEVVRG